MTDPREKLVSRTISMKQWQWDLLDEIREGCPRGRYLASLMDLQSPLIIRQVEPLTLPGIVAGNMTGMHEPSSSGHEPSEVVLGTGRKNA